MFKLKPKKFTNEQKEALRTETPVQEVVKGVPKSLDPKNFPVFAIPLNKKVLVYVPNHVVVDEDGNERLRMDTPLVHSVVDGKRFLNIRCISGLSESTGYSGNCPLCDAISDGWDLANIKIEEKCKAAGLDPKDIENKLVKSIRSSEFSDRAIKEPVKYYTFPIVVFETVNDDGKTFVTDEKGHIKCMPMWYSISEQGYEEKWLKSLEVLEDAPSHPGGRFFMLNYCYTPKNGEPNIRDCAKNMVVGVRNITDSEKTRQTLDKLTNNWTPEKAQETVIANVFNEESDLEEAADTIMEATRRLLEFYKNRDESMPTQGLEDKGGFNLKPAAEKESVGSAPLSIDTDLDDTPDGGYKMQLDEG